MGAFQKILAIIFALTIIAFFLKTPTAYAAGKITNVCGNCNSANECGLSSCSCSTSGSCYSGFACGQYCTGYDSGGASCLGPAIDGAPGYTDVWASNTDAGTPNTASACPDPGNRYVHCDGNSGCTQIFRATGTNYDVNVDSQGHVHVLTPTSNTTLPGTWCRVQLDTYNLYMGGNPTDFIVWRDPNLCSSPPPSCGNGVCDSGETCTSCSTDCGACPPVPYYTNVSPSDGQTGVSLTPNLTWATNNPFTDGGSYSTYHIYSDSGTTEIASGGVTGAGNSATYTGNVLRYNIQYWWNVHGYNNGTYWATSPITSFRTVTDSTSPVCNSLTFNPPSSTLTTNNVTVTPNMSDSGSGLSSVVTQVNAATDGSAGGTWETINNTTGLGGAPNWTSNITWASGSTTHTAGTHMVRSTATDVAGNTGNCQGTYTLISPAIFQTWGGDVSSKNQIINTYLPVSYYISNNQ